ncbi:hypothetical protein C1I60_15235 [Paenibacillus terrae]|uniref:Uncharacterized protein n=1 Tax=Paenibacillus terrae TaxID=159743 RepID=A0A4U2PTQ1_9BACL|nr:hypothetical protein C1I60_15235 [Paenibacillus terrae]
MDEQGRICKIVDKHNPKEGRILFRNSKVLFNDNGNLQISDLETAEWSENAIVYIENGCKITADFKGSSSNASRIRLLPDSSNWWRTRSRRGKQTTCRAYI